jgi:hypothetical protein
MTKRQEPNPYVMLNLFQHLVCFFLPSADAPFIPVHRMGFSGATINKSLWFNGKGKDASFVEGLGCSCLR